MAGNFRHIRFCYRISTCQSVFRAQFRDTVINKRFITSDGKPKIYVTRRIPPRGLKSLQSTCNIVQWDSDEVVPREELLKNVKDMDGLYCLLTDRIDKEVLEAAGPNLKVVSTMSVGFDHIDLDECKKRNIPVGYTPGVLTEATAELTVSLLLTVARRIPEGIEAAKNGEWGTWKPLWMCGATLENSTVGIVGLGRIGCAVAKRLRPFGVSKLLYFNRKASELASEVDAELVDMDTLLAKSDFVIATCALTKETTGMFDMNLFSKMKSSAIFINTSRGGVVNQEDLAEALRSGSIRAAGLDVTTPEPLPLDSPLFKLSNCVVLPHIASATDDTRNHMSELAARNLIAALGGEKMPASVF